MSCLDLICILQMSAFLSKKKTLIYEGANSLVILTSYQGLEAVNAGEI